MKLELRQVVDTQVIEFHWDGEHIASATPEMLLTWIGPLGPVDKGFQGMNHIHRQLEPVFEANGWEAK